MVVVKVIIGISALLGVLVLLYGIGLVTIKVIFKEDPNELELVMPILVGLMGVLILGVFTCLCMASYLLGGVIIDYFSH
jgi:tetrahydromethanopterin S-methyltransferase subunit D